MQYATQEAPTAAYQNRLGDVAGKSAIEAKRLESLLNQIDKQLAVLAEGVVRVQHFKSRLLNPRPENAEKPQDTPHPGSVEGRLQAISHALGIIGERLHATAQELEAAA